MYTCAPNFAYALTIRKTTSEQRAALRLQHFCLALNGAEAIQPSTLRSFSEAFAEQRAAMAALQKQVTAQQKELVTALETIRAAVEYDDDDGHPKTVA